MSTKITKRRVEQAERSLADALDAIGPFLPKREIFEIQQSDRWYVGELDQTYNGNDKRESLAGGVGSENARP